MKKTIKTANWTFDSVTELEPLKLNKADALLFRKQVIYAGNHVKGKDQEFTVDEDLIDHWVDTGNEMLGDGVEIPMPKQHNENDPELNRGFVNKFVKAQDNQGRPSLYVFGKFADRESAKLAKRANVSLFSPADRAIGGKVYKRPITHVSFTNYPVVRGLEGFTELKLSYDDSQMIFAADETKAIDSAGREMAGSAGKAFVCSLDDGSVLVCADVPLGADPFFCFVKENK